MQQAGGLGGSLYRLGCIFVLVLAWLEAAASRDGVGVAYVDADQAAGVSRGSPHDVTSAGEETADRAEYSVLHGARRLSAQRP